MRNNQKGSKMTNDFYAKHKEKINQAISKTPVRYSIGENPNANITVYCYYIDKKDISIAVYGKYDKTSKSITGYSAKVTLQNEHLQDSKQIAKELYALLSEQYSEQIAKTCLKHNFSNAAFRKKR